MKRLVGLLSLASALLLVLAAPAAAHPLGNFTTNTSAAIVPGDEGVRVVYVVDLAEVPAQRAQQAIADAGGEQPWATAECEQIATEQQLAVDGGQAPLAVTSVAISFPPGQAGLDTLRLRCGLEAPADLAGNSVELTYVDGYRADRIGWREVVAAADDVAIAASDVPEESMTDQLRSYPTDQPSTVTTATLTIDPSGDGPPAPVEALLRTDSETFEPAPPASGLEGLVERYTELVARQDLTPPFVLLAIVLAIALGTAHAVAPGHGKTVIAAYLLGEGGQARQAVGLGTTVAITHTIGVLVLGVIVQTSTTLAPERLYPILGVAGGILFALVGATLLHRAITRRGHDHSHDHSHGHDHGHHEHAHDGHDHDHADPVHGHASPEPASSGWRMLILPGLAGGMVPSPSALLVLLGGIAIGRTWFGVVLVLCYGIGMALALVGAGYLLHRVRFAVAERLESRTWARVSAALPVATSSLIIVGGLVIVARSLVLG